MRLLALLLTPFLAFSLTLEEAVKLARERASEVRISRLDAEKARKEFLRSLSALLPRLSFTYSYTHLDPNLVFGFGIQDRQEFSLSLIQTVFNLTALRAVWASKEGEELKRLVLKDAEREITYHTKDAFYALLYRKALIELGREELAYWREYYRLVEKRYEAGLVPKIELVRARAQLKSSEASLKQKETDYENALEEFLAFLKLEKGEPEGSLELPPERFSYEELKEALLKNNSTLRVARKALRLAGLQVKVVEGEYLPSVEAFADYRGFTGRKTLYGGTVWIKGYSVGLRVSYNLFDGLSREARRASARIEFLKEQERLLDLRYRLLAELKKTLNALEAVSKQIEATRLSLEASKEALRLATERYAHGVGSYLEVLEARKNLTETKARLYELMYRRASLRAYLERLTR
ncbi:MAG: TolC family protein [Aquificae bacterium]|nr:TolC family protein [Aquificota bacterium]